MDLPSAECECGESLAVLILAAVAGSILYDAATNYAVWQRGSGPRLRRRLPYDLTWGKIVVAAVFRSAVAATAVFVFAWAMGAVVNRTGAVAVGLAVQAAIQTFAGINENHLSERTEEKADD
jgi:hypothetical protein